jgi:hypothetical protein
LVVCVCVCVYYYTTYYIHFPRWKPPTVRKEKKIQAQPI